MGVFRRWWPTVMWLAISRGVKETTPVKLPKRAALSHVINVAKGASQRQAAALAESIAYSSVGVK